MIADFFPPTDVGWANAQPDAVAEADFTVNGTSLSFKGVGYHDKNWGDIPFWEAVQSWYWGHARLGPYSLVWFDTQARDGKEYYSGYVTKDGKIIEGSCADKAVVARPWGKNSQYPPVPETGAPEGFSLTFDLGKGETFTANVTIGVKTFDFGYYQRFIGDIQGGPSCGGHFEGRTLLEQFKLPLQL